MQGSAALRTTNGALRPTLHRHAIRAVERGRESWTRFVRPARGRNRRVFRLDEFLRGNDTIDYTCNHFAHIIGIFLGSMANLSPNDSWLINKGIHNAPWL